MDYKQLKSSLIKHTGYMFGGNIVVAGLSFLINIILVRTLGAKDNGLIVLTISTASLISLFFDLRFGEAVIKYVGDYISAKDKNRALGVIFIGYLLDVLLGVFCFLVLVLGAGHISVLMNQPQLSRLLFIYSFMILIGAVNNTSSNIFYSFRDFKWITVQTILLKSFDFAFILVALYLQQGAEGVISAYLLSSVLMTLIISAKAVFKIKTEFKKTNPVFQGINFRELFGFIFHTTLASTLKSVIRYIDVLILGYFKDPRAITYYKNGIGLGNMLGLISDPVYKVVYPVIVNLKNVSDIVTIKKIARKVMIYGALIGIPVGIFASMIAPLAVRLLYKGVSDPSAGVLRLVIWVQVINLMLCWQRPVCLAFGRSDIGSKVGMAGLILFCALLFWLVPKYSYIGAATAYLITYTFNILLVNFYTVKIIKSNSR